MYSGLIYLSRRSVGPSSLFYLLPFAETLRVNFVFLGRYEKRNTRASSLSEKSEENCLAVCDGFMFRCYVLFEFLFFWRYVWGYDHVHGNEEKLYYPKKIVMSFGFERVEQLHLKFACKKAKLDQ
jgi:hypothetical protein